MSGKVSRRRSGTGGCQLVKTRLLLDSRWVCVASSPPTGCSPSSWTVGEVTQFLSSLRFVFLIDKQGCANGLAPCISIFLCTTEDPSNLNRLFINGYPSMTNPESERVPLGLIIEVFGMNHCRVKANNSRWGRRRRMPKDLKYG
jgi:hypothetical protein